ncbi:MAG: PASTA domain-containing protein [Deltaproteobacteria bacterium]|nr:PASTA domain-containing protein [Deltaproteobacteria bacterium]
MTYSEYPNDSGAPSMYARRSPGIFTVVLTSVITSTVITVAVLFVTGNLTMDPVEDPTGLGVEQHFLVPSLIGIPTQSAKELLTARKLRMVVRAEKPHKSMGKGLIIEQNPLPDSDLEAGGEVAIVVSSGPKKTTVPPVVGKSLEEAKKLLATAGIDVGNVSFTGTGDPGSVTQVTPGPGTEVADGAQVVLVAAPMELEVPKLLGKRTGQAKKMIQEAGFKVGKIRWRYNEDRPANLVLGQTPAAGSKAPPDTAIDLILNEE